MGAPSTYSTLGWYINNFKSSATDTSWYTKLLGNDGLGNNPNGQGNKIDKLYSEMEAFGVNYAILYDLSDADFLPTPLDSAAEAFSAAGTTKLQTLISRGKTNYGITEYGAVCDLHKGNLTTNRFDGTSQIRKIIKYNNDVLQDPNKILEWINIETEFWNFPEQDLANASGTITASGTTITGVGTNFGGQVQRNFFIKVGSEYRQVVKVTSTTVAQIDRPFGSSVSGASYEFVDPNGTVDFQTFKYRMAAIRAYVDANGNGEKIEMYVGFPDYTNYGANQLSQLVPYFDRILLHNYAYKPSYGRIQNRLANDIVNAALPIQCGIIISMESATTNNANNCNCPPSANTNNNFTGYLMEGRTQNPVNSSGIAIPVCVCCATPLFPPPVTYASKSYQDLWDYVIKYPAIAGPPSASTPTYNDPSLTERTALDTYVTMDTLIIFDQEFVRQLVMNPPTPLNVTALITNVGQCQTATGSIALTVTGGIAPYTYLWSPGSQTTSSITGQVAGSYSCLITDSNLDTVTWSGSITKDAGSFTVTETETVASCSGAGGRINIINVTGGTPPYTYTLNGTPFSVVSFPHTITTAFGTPFVLEIEDSGGCTYTRSSSIALPTITVTPTNILASACAGSSSGQFTVTASGGTGPYTYTCALGTQTSSGGVTFTGATGPGNYGVVAVDSKGCQGGVTVTVPATSNPASVSVVGIDASCTGGADGSAVAIATGGTEPYTYYWSTGLIGIDEDTETGLSPGTYTVTVIDDAGCTSNTASVTIGSSTPISALYDVTNVSNGTTDTGSITLNSISGGTAPYSYSWSNSETTSSISNLPIGTYTVTITDDNGCQLILSFKIVQECSITNDKFFISLYNLRCCAGNLSIRLRKALEIGNLDLYECLIHKFKLIHMIIRTLSSIHEPTADDCLSCDDINQLILLGREICDCECDCDTSIGVTYNPVDDTLNKIE